MSTINALAHLKQYGKEDQVIAFETSSATVELAAAAIGCTPEVIAKTMAFYGGDGPVLIVTAGDTRVDNKKFKGQFRIKAKMIAPRELEELVGHAMGGVCPFGVKEGVEVYLDRSLKRFDHVYPACGSENTVVALPLGELEEISEADGWVDVCKEVEA